MRSLASRYHVVVWVCLVLLCVTCVSCVMGDDIDLVTDCRIRDYMYQYANTQLHIPQRAPQHGLVYGSTSIYDALELKSRCNMSQPTPTPNPSSSSAPSSISTIITSLIQPITSRHGNIQSLYVKMSSTCSRPGVHSDRSHAGSTPQHAISICDLSADLSLIQSFATPSYDFLIIYLLPGTYPLSHPLIFTAHDQNMILTAYQPNTAILTTALPLANPRWTRMTHNNHDIWKTPCPECATITAAAKSRPLPATSPKATNVAQFELYVDGQVQTLARWPNLPHRFSIWPDGYAASPSWIAPDQAAYDPTRMIVQTPERTFASSQAGLSTHFEQLLGGSQAGDQFVDGVQRGVPRAHESGTTGPIGFVYDGNQFSNKSYTNGGRGARVHALHDRYWGNWQWEVSHIDPSTRTVSFGWGGYQQNQGRQAGSQFFIENVLEELDQPQEWYYDESSHVLYYYGNSTRSSPPSSVSISSHENMITISGTQHVPISNLHIIGLIFQYTHPTYLSSYMTPSGGDWAVHPNGAIYIQGCVACSIQSNLFQNLGGNAIYIAGYNRNITIGYNEFIALGDSAIVSVGESAGIDGTQGTHPYGNYIHHNIAHELGLYGKQTAFYFQAITAYTTLQSNVVFNVPRAAICFNDGFGGGHQVYNNVLFNTVRETADHGAFNSWDRDAFVTRYATGFPSLYPALSYLHHNLIMGNYESGWPIDHDDGSAFYVDTYNVLIYGGYKNLWGHDMVTTNNLYIHPDAITLSRFPTGVKSPACLLSAFGSQDSGANEIWANNTCILRSVVAEVITSCSRPNVTDPPTPITHDNQFYSPAGQVYTVCGNPFLLDGVTPNFAAFVPLTGPGGWQSYQQDVGSTVGFSQLLTPESIIQQIKLILE